MMPYLDKDGHVCGFLDYEERVGSNAFLRRFFMLDEQKGVLKYYMDNPQNLAPGSQEVNQFNLQFISIVGDAKHLKPKEPFTFYITFAGKDHFLKADNSTDKEEWIRVLKEATRVVVNEQDVSGFTLQQQSQQNNVQSTDIQSYCGSYQVEAFGDILLKTEIKQSGSYNEADNSHSSTQSLDPSCNQQVIKKGYITKQGFIRKNWKKRFFVLTPITLSYFEDEEDKKPLRVISLADVIEARVSVGIHLSKEHVLEVVTGQRVFYMQTETAGERDSWIVAINQCIDKLRQPRFLCGARPSRLRLEHLLSSTRRSSWPGRDVVQLPPACCQPYMVEGRAGRASALYQCEPCHCSEKIRSSVLCIRL